jgi:hypothetical protein
MQVQPQAQQQLTKVINDRPKMGAVILIIGRQGSGKTPVTQREAEASGFDNLVVYDPRKEYDLEKYTIFYKLSTFKKFITTARNCFIICEEATGFVNSFKDMEFTDFIIGVQHNCNIIVFIFHSLSDAPTYILRLCRFVVLLRTNDEPEVIQKNRPKFFPYLEKVTTEGDQYIDVNEL